MDQIHCPWCACVWHIAICPYLFSHLDKVWNCLVESRHNIVTFIIKAPSLYRAFLNYVLLISKAFEINLITIFDRIYLWLLYRVRLVILLWVGRISTKDLWKSVFFFFSSCGGNFYFMLHSMPCSFVWPFSCLHSEQQHILSDAIYFTPKLIVFLPPLCAISSLCT